MKEIGFVRIVKFLAFIGLIILAIGTAVMVVWNVLMPSLFNLPSINFIQAIGLLILSRLLTGGFRFGLGYGGGKYWLMKEKMWEKWSSMTPEERDKWKQEWRNRCESRRPIGWKNYEKEDGKDQI